jgi:hypothetical protein
MNNPENVITTAIAPGDAAFIEGELARSPRPATLHDLAQKLAFLKTAGQRSKDVKRYDPNARYEVGDYVYKDYDETLTVGSKNVEHFKGSVILKVVGRTFYKSFNCEMLEVDHDGGGVFRKYIDYMKKTKTLVLLPSNVEGRNAPAEILDRASDPRLTELPMTERDLKTLEKNLRTELGRSPALFGWNESWQILSRRVDVPEAKVKEIGAEFERAQSSASTEDLVKKFFGLEASSDLFDLTCMSLGYALDKKHRKDFVALTYAGWGRWHLKKILNALPEGLPLAAPLARVPELMEIEKPEMSHVQDFPIKVYLTWREILSGGIKIPRSLGKALSHAREYAFTDPEDGKTYTLFYYPTSGYFLGLKDFYVAHNIPQGTSLTLERKGPAQFHFWIKKSKKKISALKLAYDPAEDRFADNGEEAFTFAEPNKIIYLERENIASLLPLYEQRADLDLKDLLILVYKDPALSSPGHALHFLRAYHLVDILKQTTQEDVEFTLLNSSEFAKSEKKKGIFVYQEPISEIEDILDVVPTEAPAAEEEILPRRARRDADYLPPGTVGFLEEEEEEPFQEGEPEIIDLTPKVSKPAPARAPARGAAPAAEPDMPPPAPPTTEQEKAKAATTAKKEKAPKKKKLKLEGDKSARPKKSERRVIEERLVEEESEMEALAAVKQKEETPEEQRARTAREKREKKEEVKPVSKEEPTKFGVFGDLLKSALVQKKKDEPAAGEEDEDKDKKKD